MPYPRSSSGGPRLGGLVRLLTLLLLTLTLPAIPRVAAATDAPENPGQGSSVVPGTPATPARLFDQVWALVRDELHDPELLGVDWEDAGRRHRARIPGAEAGAGMSPEALDVTGRVINDLLAELNVSHTRFFSRDDPALHQLLDLFSSGPMGPEIEALYPGGRVSYPGIGIFAREVSGTSLEVSGTFVIGVLEGGPAHAAGVLVGDRLLSVDGEPFHPIRSFRDRVGKPLTLLVERERGRPPVALTVTPADLQPGELFLRAMRESARVIDHRGVKVATVHVWSYAGEQYQELLVELLTRGPLAEADALVLDLRDGWGGASPEYLHLFSHRVPVLEQIPRRGEPFTFDPHWRKPVGLLVNGGTRSGKELLAHAFRRHGYGPVLGTRTAGAVTAGRPFLLHGGHLLFLAVADVRVDGERLEGVGVEPDVLLLFDIPYARGADPQLEGAVAHMARRVSESGVGESMGTAAPSQDR